jgi:copper homeostasis protein (lipoprotein)
MKLSSTVVVNFVQAGLLSGVLLLITDSLRADEMSVEGTATLQEPVALPPTAALEVTLEDISRADAPAEILGRVQIDDPGYPPFHFVIAYDQARIQPNHSYAVRARIAAQGRLLFTTDQVYPVLTGNHGREVELVLRRVAAAPPEAAAALHPPVTFAGELPCADCPGQKLVLTLYADHSYRLRRTYREADHGADAVFYELGRWQRTDDGVHLVTAGADPTAGQYRLLSSDRLRMLDRDGNPIDSPFNYDLVRQAEIDPVAGPMALRGLYAYMADAATFNECNTGKRYPVSLEAAHIDIESAYLELSGDNPGAPLLATLQGRFEERTSDPAAGGREHLIVERFERFWPGETCAREALSRASLVNTYWRPVEIDGEPVVLNPGQREPHFVLASAGDRVHGFNGCNRFMGGFEQAGEKLHFTALASTRMACPPAATALETRFMDALQAAASQRVVGESLELRDAQGQLRMRLESRYMR